MRESERIACITFLAVTFLASSTAEAGVWASANAQVYDAVTDTRVNESDSSSGAVYAGAEIARFLGTGLAYGGASARSGDYQVFLESLGNNGTTASALGRAGQTEHVRVVSSVYPKGTAAVFAVRIGLATDFWSLWTGWVRDPQSPHGYRPVNGGYYPVPEELLSRGEPFFASARFSVNVNNPGNWSTGNGMSATLYAAENRSAYQERSTFIHTFVGESFHLNADLYLTAGTSSQYATGQVVAGFTTTHLQAFADGWLALVSLTPDVSYVTLSGVTLPPVPEPRAYAMMMAGLGLILSRLRVIARNRRR